MSSFCCMPTGILSALAMIGLLVPTKWNLYVSTAGLNRQGMQGPEKVINDVATAMRSAIDARG